MEWNNNIQGFAKTHPEPSPKITVNVSLMKEFHSQYNPHIFKSKLKNIQMRAIADTGCQTTTCGPEILQLIGVDHKDLINTRHGMIGITGTSPNIIGVLMAEIEW